jgi:hypothetical protein
VLSQVSSAPHNHKSSVMTQNAVRNYRGEQSWLQTKYDET